MKREMSCIDKSVKRHYSFFFWELCISCKKEFRRENGFRFELGPYFDRSGMGIPTGTTYHLCGEYAPTVESALEFKRTFK